MKQHMFRHFNFFSTRIHLKKENPNFTPKFGKRFSEPVCVCYTRHVFQHPKNNKITNKKQIKQNKKNKLTFHVCDVVMLFKNFTSYNRIVSHLLFICTRIIHQKKYLQFKCVWLCRYKLHCLARELFDFHFLKQPFTSPSKVKYYVASVPLIYVAG